MSWGTMRPVWLWGGQPVSFGQDVTSPPPAPVRTVRYVLVRMFADGKRFLTSGGEWDAREVYAFRALSEGYAREFLMEVVGRYPSNARNGYYLDVDVEEMS